MTLLGVAQSGIGMDEPRFGRLSKEDLHHLVEVAEGHSLAARRAREILLAHFSRELDPPGPRRRKDVLSRQERVRAALRELGVAPGEASVREVAARAGLPATTTHRLLRDLGAPERRRRAPPRPAPGEASREEEAAPAPGILLVGLGGAGGRVLHRLHALCGLEGARTLAIDTDAAALDAQEADTKLLVGRSSLRGAGTGGAPEVGERCASGAADGIRRTLAGARLVFLVAGMGGGTGTGAAPVVAHLAREQGATVVAVVSMPFQLERARLARAASGLARLREVAHTTLPLDDDRLLRFAPNLPLDQAFLVMDTLVAETLRSIVDTLTKPSLLALDAEETRTLLASGGAAALLYGESRSPDPRSLVREAVLHAFADADPSRATGALVSLTAGADISLGDARAILDHVARELPAGARVVWGARRSEAAGARVRLCVVLTGLGVSPRTP